MVVFLLLGLLAGQNPAPSPTSRAESLVAALSKSDFEGAARDFDDAMKKAAPPDQLKKIWETMVGQVGSLKKTTGSRTESKPPYEIVFVSCEFEKANLDLRIVVNKDQQISGFQIVPPRPKVPYKSPGYVNPAKFDLEEVVVGKGTAWELPGTLSRPKDIASPPCVILVHGSGPHDRDETIGSNKPFRDLADGLASRGLAVLRYEKRTKAHASKMKRDSITIDEETVDDARAAVSLLKQMPGIDPKRIYLLGHSLGGLMAPKIAKLEPDLAGIILLAGPSRPMEDLILEQVEYLSGLKGDAEATKAALAKLKEQVARVRDPKLSPAVPAEDLPLGVPAAYWLSLRGYDPVTLAASLPQRILVLQGDRDYQVTTVDFAGWEKALGQKPSATLKRFAKLNHLFAEGEGKSTPAEYDAAGHIAADAIEFIAGWVNSTPK